LETGQKDASAVTDALEAGLVWICGQFSNGRTPKLKKKNNMSRDGAFGEHRGENRFWAVATPL
jgi:hypothetical protein